MQQAKIGKFQSFQLYCIYLIYRRGNELHCYGISVSNLAFLTKFTKTNLNYYFNNKKV